MDRESEVMAPEEATLRQQMEDTRASLTEKLESLEQEVSDTVEGATSAVATVKETVEDTVGTVKESVQDAITALKNSFDLPRHVQNYPWTMVGGSVVAGYLMGRLLERLTAHAPAANGNHSDEKLASTPSPSINQSIQPTASKPANGSWLAAWAKPLEPELAKLKALALGTAMGLVRDMVVEAAPPQIAPDLTDVINTMTQKLGGETIYGPVVRHFSGTDTDEGEIHEERDTAEMGRPLGAAYR